MKFYRKTKINGKNIKTHRLVMENHLGRPLLFTEYVGHIDGDLHNNDISNLVVLTEKEYRGLGLNGKAKIKAQELGYRETVWDRLKQKGILGVPQEIGGGRK